MSVELNLFLSTYQFVLLLGYMLRQVPMLSWSVQLRVFIVSVEHNQRFPHLRFIAVGPRPISESVIPSAWHEVHLLEQANTICCNLG